MVEYFPLVCIEIEQELATAVYPRLSHLLPKSIRFRLAVHTAYKKFEEHYPQWVAALFDYSFLQKEAAALMAQYMYGSHLPTAEDIAYAWRWHLGSGLALREAHHVGLIVPAISDFLEWFEEIYLG
jgi:Gpi18-like mannosyltransferase